MAATSATEAEQQTAKQGQADGSTPVTMEKRTWRPKVENVYLDPEVEIDHMESLDWLFKEEGKVIIKNKRNLPPRDDIIQYNPELHSKTLDNKIQWRDCPEQWRPVIRAIIEEYYDCFEPKGMKRPIRGYLFNIDTGTSKPITCKTPRYGPHESKVMERLIKTLEDKGMIEDNFGPYGAMAVLAGKPGQAHVHWTEYIFRLCISYRPLNTITRPFLFHIQRCDDAVDMIGTACFAITMDLDSGYWQVEMLDESKEKTAFYTPNGKKHWTRMPMGILNAHAFFTAMVADMKTKWDAAHGENAEEMLEKISDLYAQVASKQDMLAAIPCIHAQQRTRLEKAQMMADIKQAKQDGTWKPAEEVPEQANTGRTTRDDVPDVDPMFDFTKEQLTQSNPGSAVIVDDIILYDKFIPTLLAYFVNCLKILLFYRVTVNLRKTRVLPRRAKFVGVDVMKEGNAPAQSKYEPIRSLATPKLFSDIRMLTGVLGFYQR
jgi:hypothetical protein